MRPALFGLPRIYWVLWAGQLINRLGSFALPFLPIYLVDRHRYTSAAAGDAALVNETLAPLGTSPEASELRAELAATLGDGVGAVRTLREAAAASPGSAVVHAALAQAIWFFARPGRPDIDPRLLGDLARDRWAPLAYDHARVALCVAPDDADDRWLERLFAHVQALQAEVRGANAWGVWSTAPPPPPPLPVGYLGRRGRVPPPVTEGFEESCEALLRRVGVSARAREPWPTHP